MALLITDPVCFRRDENGGLKFPLELASGLEAAAIGAKARLALFAGEWFADLEAGVRYVANATVEERAAILGQAYEPAKARAEFRRELLTTPGVVDVPTLELALDPAERRLAVTFVARTVWGDTPPTTLELEL